MVEVLWLILVGAIVGFLGRLVAGRDVDGPAMFLIGVVGTFLGFYIWYGIAGGNNVIIGYICGVLVAALLVTLIGRAMGHGARGTRPPA